MPQTQKALMVFGDVLMVFGVRGLVDEQPKDSSPRKGAKPPRSKDTPRVANEYYTTEGRIADGRFYPKNGGSPEKLADLGGKVSPGGPFGSFINAIRSRKEEDLNANAEIAHYSAALCHLANISYRLGQRVSWDQKAKTLGDNKVVYETFAALENNLTK